MLNALVNSTSATELLCQDNYLNFDGCSVTVYYLCFRRPHCTKLLFTPSCFPSNCQLSPMQLSQFYQGRIKRGGHATP